jgi:hypothetical protein
VLDSCLDSAKQVAPLAYLTDLGIDVATAVRVVVATHWHDDHARGLAKVVAACRSAEFICASALTKPEFLRMVTRYEERNQLAGTSGVSEISHVLHHMAASGRRPRYALADRPVYRFGHAEGLASEACIMTTLSPADKQLELFWSEIAALMPDVQQTKRRAVPRGPNHVAVAVWLAVGGEISVLLGSDLEETPDQTTGWSVIVDSELRPPGFAAVFKIPHHGSETGQSAEVWRHLVATNAYALLTPFMRGRVQLPTDAGVRYILDHTERAFSTSHLRARSVTRRTPVVERAIRETVGRFRSAESRFGQVRLRRKYVSGSSWSVELFGSACALEEIFQ